MHPLVDYLWSCDAPQRPLLIPSSLRLTVSSELTEAELGQAAHVIKQAIAKHIIA